MCVPTPTVLTRSSDPPMASVSRRVRTSPSRVSAKGQPCAAAHPDSAAMRSTTTRANGRSS